MKKFFIVLLLIGVNLYANLHDDGVLEFKKGNYQEGSRLLKESCDRGFMRDCVGLGILYSNGIGVTKNYQKAKQLLTQGCNGGLMQGCVSLGILYVQIQNYQEAKQLFKKTCNMGLMQGCFSLGLLYFNGKGVTKNYQEAKQLFKKSCNGGFIQGCTFYKALISQGY